MTGSWDPLDIQGPETSEIVAAARKREISNILKSYVGFFDPFSELIQNALDAIDMRRATEDVEKYAGKVWIKIDIARNELSVTDNGIGFGEEQFRMFLTPSISFKTSGDTRGNKGVGATYLGYGFNYLQMGTKSKAGERVAEIKNGREWVDDKAAIHARPLVKASKPIHKPFQDINQGSTFTLRLDGNVRPSNLGWIGATNADQWRILLLLKTPLGQLFRSDKGGETLFDLQVIDKSGKETNLTDQECAYLLPHLAIKGTARIQAILDVQQELIKKKKDTSKLPAKFKRLNGVYDFWSTNDLEQFRLEDGEKQLLKKHKVSTYGFFCYSATKVLDRYNDDVAKLRKGLRVIKGGLQMATNGMPQGELMLIPLTSNIGYQNQSHVVVHFENADPDLGRKGFQPELEQLAATLSVGIVGRLKQWRHLLLTDRGPGGSHEQDLKLDDWIEEQKGYEKANPVSLENANFFIPVNEVSISAAPSSEQDVVALFNQLLAGGVIRGIRVMASSSHHQYDGLYRYHLRPPIDNHYHDEETNPLGIEDTQNIEGFLSKPYVLEFKHNMDALIADFENEEKHESAIDLAIAWEMGERWKERYQTVSLLLPDNLHLRQFHGITHEFHDDNTGEKRMDVFILKDLINFLNKSDEEIANQESKYGEPE